MLIGRSKVPCPAIGRASSFLAANALVRSDSFESAARCLRTSRKSPTTSGSFRSLFLNSLTSGPETIPDSDKNF